MTMKEQPMTDEERDAILRLNGLDDAEVKRMHEAMVEAAPPAPLHITAERREELKLKLAYAQDYADAVKHAEKEVLEFFGAEPGSMEGMLIKNALGELIWPRREQVGISGEDVEALVRTVARLRGVEATFEPYPGTVAPPAG